MERYCNTDFHQEKFETPEDSLELIQNQQQQDQNNMLSVKQFLSQPNPLMNKIQFKPYQPHCYYPRALGRLPKCLKDYSCVQQDKNNMNSILESRNGHQKLKKDVMNALLNKPIKHNIDRKFLSTLEDHYQNMTPIYERYTLSQMKLEQNKFKLKYFATFVLDMAKILKKQMRINQHPPGSTNTQYTSINRPASTAKAVNFNIRQYRTPILEKNNMATSRKSLMTSKIEFDSNFESGNMFRVYQKQHNEFDLILQNDINTKGNNQWFFFNVKGVPKNTTLKFNIVNMSKKTSLFNIGMKPYVFSMMRYEKRNVGWVRQGMNISYEQSQFLRKQSSNAPYYQLSFEYKFIQEGDIVYFSHSIPYTLTDLSNYLNKTLDNKKLHKIIKLKHLGYTLGSNEVDLIEVTNTHTNASVNKNKKAVWITARQHSGQTTSGFMLEGILDYLISDCQQSRFLLNNFIFKIVPMVNVDGVIHGNTRAQFIGADPNRKWANPHKLHNPIIHSLKHYIQKNKANIEMVMDLHSHSRKLGSFFYGNTMSNNTASSRIYPLMVCKQDERFSYKNSRFSGGNSTTARHVLFQSLRIPLIYTVQCSFYGYQVGQYGIKQYFPNDYKQMGRSLMVGFGAYEMKKNSKSLTIQKGISHVQSSNKDIQEIFDSDQLENGNDSQSVGSEQDPSEDEYNDKQFKNLINKEQKKKKKTKKKKEPILKVKLKDNQTIQVVKKSKTNNSESYYKDYFSGIGQSKRQNNLTDKVKLLLGTVKKQYVSFGVQVSINQNTCTNTASLSRRQSAITSQYGSTVNVLTERNVNTRPKSRNALMPVNNLCVIGQKVEQISIYGNTVGTQATDSKQVFINRAQGNMNGRKSFSVRTRPTAFLQIKQNNFLQRGDYANKNFFSRK